MVLDEKYIRKFVRESLIERIDIADPAGPSPMSGGDIGDVDERVFSINIPEGAKTIHPVPIYKGRQFSVTSLPSPERTITVQGKRKTSIHSGIDIGTPVGTPLLAYADGRVVTAKYDSGGGGNIVAIKHDAINANDGVNSGILTTIYMHMSSIAVERGQKVKAGNYIGLSGESGNVTGPHLHFTLKLGRKKSYDASFYKEILNNATQVKVEDQDPDQVADTQNDEKTA